MPRMTASEQAEFLDSPGLLLDEYVQETIDQTRALLRVHLDAATVRSWRMPLEGEPYEGMWHRRYFRPESKLGRRF